MNGNDMREKGTTLNIDGKERHLTFDLNALCELEDKYKDLQQASIKLMNPNIKDVRYFLTLALRHDDESLTEKQVGKMITVENLQEVVNAIGVAFGKSLPEASENGKNS